MFIQPKEKNTSKVVIFRFGKQNTNQTMGILNNREVALFVKKYGTNLYIIFVNYADQKIILNIK